MRRRLCRRPRRRHHHHQSSDQSINQLINQSIIQLFNQSINKSISQSINRLIKKIPARAAGSGIKNNYEEYLQFLLVSGFVTNKAMFVSLYYVNFRQLSYTRIPTLFM